MTNVDKLFEMVYAREEETGINFEFFQLETEPDQSEQFILQWSDDPRQYEDYPDHSVTIERNKHGWYHYPTEGYVLRFDSCEVTGEHGEHISYYSASSTGCLKAILANTNVREEQGSEH